LPSLAQGRLLGPVMAAEPLWLLCTPQVDYNVVYLCLSITERVAEYALALLCSLVAAALFLDGSGGLLIADGGNNAIRKVNLTSMMIATVAGSGVAGSTGDGGYATSAKRECVC
jgi:hypothetical protein